MSFLRSQEPFPAFKSGFLDITPLSFGVALYGAAFGLLAAQAGIDTLQTGVMGSTVFAGASQIVAAERLVSGAGATAALIAGLALNVRILLMTASLREEFAGRPLWQILLGVHMTTDENWALMHATRAQGRPAGYWYLVGGGASLFLVWITSTLLGVSFAAMLPEPRAIGMDFAFTAAFIAILCSLWRGKGDALPWLAAVASAGALTLFAPIEPSWALICGGIVGAATAGVFCNG
ncbi:AzlC family ABC transporter permease [Roseovarius sp. EL26]|uniref:AzlC family ABC transporter permease n=1 Tax=Roseovarius sp. EL26 TaxID=2126672 RepID=UPI000EA3891B|nr:AzlC family ABC transporter permease [Roseovarius sp. EL26]